MRIRAHALAHSVHRAHRAGGALIACDEAMGCIAEGTCDRRCHCALPVLIAVRHHLRP